LSAPRRPFRPGVECLEDRWLLSAGFVQVDLASNVPGLAAVTDVNLVNPWGMSFSPTGPFWFADNGRGVSDLLDGRGQPEPLVVAVPSPTDWGSTPTGTVFNGGPGFAISEDGITAPSRFLFAAEDGSISGWTTLVDPTHALVAVDNAGAVYKGLTIAGDGAKSFLYAADFSRGTIDVFNQDFKQVTHPGAFVDPNLPRGYAPFNVQNIDGKLFVAYARADSTWRDDVPGPGHGFVDVYATDGTLLSRLASEGTLNSPWGLALAPSDFGRFAGDLLVGNNGDGRISAFNPATGAYLGELTAADGNAIAIPGLWGLSFGNGHAGGDASTLFFSAGVNAEQDGLFGAIQAPNHIGADTGGAGGFDPNAAGEPQDYPLPPSGGPTFVISHDTRPGVFVDLLPMSESSLALVPTLTTLAPKGADGTSANAGVVRIDSATLASADAPGRESDAYRQPALDRGVALNALLDLGAARNTWATQQAPRMADSIEREITVASTVVQSTSDLPTACAVTVSTDDAGAASTDDAPRRTRSRDSMAGVTGMLVLISFPMAWACWVRQEMPAVEIETTRPRIRPRSDCDDR
jgi:uncharacterized protein (TIGR03118 family)